MFRQLKSERGVTLVGTMVVVHYRNHRRHRRDDLQICRRRPLGADQGSVRPCAPCRPYYGKTNGLFPASGGNVENLTTPIPS
jgi:hypothetical protein